MNHKFNAYLNRLPACPECGAAALQPCTTIAGGAQVREPHRVRQRVADGEVFVVEVKDARKARKARALNELVAAIQRPANDRLASDVEALKREWGLASKKKG